MTTAVIGATGNNLKNVTAEIPVGTFTSLTGGRRWLGRAAGFGDSGERIGATRVWLTNTLRNELSAREMLALAKTCSA